MCRTSSCRDLAVVALPQGSLEQDANGEGQPRQDRQAGLLEGIQPVVAVCLFPHPQDIQRIEWIVHAVSFVV